MSEEFDDFIIEEEEEGGDRRFLVIAGALVGVLILVMACILIFALSGREDNGSEVAEIETRNAITEAENAKVTQTIAALETEAAMPTETPTVPPTETPTTAPTETTAPTDTPVVQAPDETTEATGEGTDVDGDGTPDGNGETAVTPNVEGTSIFGGDGGSFSTATPISGAAGGDSGALPQTGASPLGIVAAVFVLILLAFGARRLRSG